MSEGHARFSPSKLPRIIRCPGSVKLSEQAEQKSSSYADEGTYLHEVVADHLSKKIYEVQGTLHEDKEKNAEYKDAVDTVLSWVYGLKMQHITSRFEEFVETKVSCKPFAAEFDPALTDVAGTVDYRFIIGTTLYVCDWKFGKGVEVFPDSEQFLGYAAGALAEDPNRFTSVVCVVGQPRIDGEKFKFLSYTVPDILRWVKHELSPALQLALSDSPPLIPSAYACRWCPAKNQCPERYRAAQETASEIFRIHAQLPNAVRLEELSILLRKAPLLEQYLKDLNNYAFSLLANGQQFPDHKIVAGRAIRRWANEELAKVVLEEHGYDVSELSEVKFYGPAKVEKLIDKKHRKEPFFTELIVKPDGKPTLTHDSDPRPPLTFNSAEDVFAGFATEEDEG